MAHILLIRGVRFPACTRFGELRPFEAREAPLQRGVMLEELHEECGVIGIYNGDKLFVQVCNTAKNGDQVVALIDDSATVKTFYKEDDHIRLQPENDNMDPIIVPDCQILGKVFGVYRFFR